MKAENLFREIWFVDFEFVAPEGDLQRPVCMVARELFSGQLIRLREDEMKALDRSPIDTGPDVLFVAYYASAELKCYMQLGWPLPERVMDFLVEWKWLTNGHYCSITAAYGYSLPYCLAANGVRGISAMEKTEMRDLIMSGGPWCEEEMVAILDYCQSDVDPLAELWKKWEGRLDIPRALVRGRYITAVAKMETAGIPIDVESLDRLKDNWDTVKENLVACDTFGLFDGTTFKHDRFHALVRHNQWFWPTTPEGELKTDEGTMKGMATRYPELMPLYELRRTLGEMKLNSLAVGTDGRNRCLLGPFGSKTGRNQPSNSRFVYGTARWLRHLIKPTAGKAVAYVDWSQQELGIAAVLSNDHRMQEAYTAGDPYLAFGKMTGQIPANATKQSHPNERALFKIVMLGVQFGMSEWGLAPRLGGSMKQAQVLLTNHRQLFNDYWTWSNEVVNYTSGVGHYILKDGWCIRWAHDMRKRTMANFPVQGTGAAIMRWAACLLTEAGIKVCCPVHDAFLIEADEGDIDEAVALTQKLMGDASEVLLDGFRLESDAEIVRSPDRYIPESGHELWEVATKV